MHLTYLSFSFFIVKVDIIVVLTYLIAIELGDSTYLIAVELGEFVT